LESTQARFRNLIGYGVSPLPIRQLLVFGDTYGVSQALASLSTNCVAAIVCAEIRPQYHKELSTTAQRLGVPLLIQPPKSAPTYQHFLGRLWALAPDGLICHSYSMLVPSEILELVSGRAFNVHMALLPRHRGPNPVQWALIHGDLVTGVSLHVMSDTFDTGEIVGTQSVGILEHDTWTSLLCRLKDAAQVLLDRSMPLLLSGNWTATTQDERRALQNPRVPVDSFEVKFSSMTDLQIYNLIRAQVAPLKGAYLLSNEEKTRFLDIVSREEIARLRKLYE
jgi:methionyl-tRNA formyltransferase